MNDQIVRAANSNEDEAVDIDIQVVPRASKDAIGNPHGDRLKVHVKAPPVDGRANTAVMQLLAKALKVPRSDISLVRGATGKRKTIRVASTGLGPATVCKRLGLATLLLIPWAGACSEGDDFPIAVMLPEETQELERADNASLVLQPGGSVSTFAVDGIDFSLEWELEPDTTIRTLELYLAEQEKLVGWGSSAPFSLASPTAGITIFVGPAGQLSTFPVSAPNDPELLATVAAGRGILVLEGGGETSLLNEYDLTFEFATTHPDPPPMDDGALFSAGDGSVLRLAWSTELEAWHYDPSTDAWTELILGDPAQWGARAGAASLVGYGRFDGGDDEEVVYLLGGGDRSDLLTVARLPESDGRLSVAIAGAITLDSPRRDATAYWVARGDDPRDSIIAFGGDDDTQALALDTKSGTTLGAPEAWTGAACIQLVEIDETGTAEILCAGGMRSGVATADAALITVPENGEPEIEILGGLLPAAIGDPLALGDRGSVYVQGEGGLHRFARDDLSTSESLADARRGSGGQTVLMSTGATFVLGGLDADGNPNDRWQVFTPNPE